MGKILIFIMTLSFLLFTFFSSIIAQTIIPGGDIFGTWTKSGSPYYIQGTITIPVGQLLSIAPGVKVLFGGDYFFYVHGNLEAVGDRNDSILFSMSDRRGPFWKGIRFIDLPAGGHLSYCIIENGHATGSIPDNRGGGVYIKETNPTIEHCTFRFNQASFGGAIYAVACEPMIHHCILYDNNASNYGGAIDLYGASAFIQNCTFYDNDAAAGAAVSIDLAIPTIKNSIVSGNKGNCGIYFQQNGNANITYSDFYNNEGCDFFGYVPSGMGELVGVNANEDSCDVFKNIFLDPEFVDLQYPDLHLSSSSPCINAGDPASTPDPDGTIADMGAFHYDLETGIKVALSDDSGSRNLLKIWPSPLMHYTSILFTVETKGPVLLVVYDLTGNHIETLIDRSFASGIHKSVWCASNYPSGVYIIAFQNNKTTHFQKILKF